MNQKTWANLDSRELAFMFGRIFSVDIEIGRDASLLKRLMEDHALSSLQVLYGFLTYKESQTGNNYIHAFCQQVNLWRIYDPLEAAAELRHHVTGEPLPVFYWGYLDVRDGGDTGDARATKIYQDNKSKLEEWLHGWLQKPLAPGDRAVLAQRASSRSVAAANLSGFRFESR